MSHIDEALKRATDAPGAVAPDTVSDDRAIPSGGDGADAPAPDVFSDVWSVAAVPVPGDQRAGDDAALVPPGGGAVPLTEPAAFSGFHLSHAEKVVVAPEVRPGFVEQYRRLAGMLHHAQVERGIKVVMVTSTLAGEGKTLTATNLALTFSESYHRSVLLVDADLRRPTLHEVFQVVNVSGLGDGLRSSEPRKLSLVDVSPRLTLLPAGRPDPDPMSGLTSGRMTALLDEAAARFDWVIIDTPPVGVLPDANLLARMVDATLLVVRAGQTPYHMIQRAVATIGRDRIVGVVLNGADDTVDASYNYYSYYEGHGKKNGK